MEARSVHLGLLLLLAAQEAPAIAVASHRCQKQCGGVDIHYPFAIGDNCSRSLGFNVSCQELQDGFYKPFLSGGDFEPIFFCF